MSTRVSATLGPRVVAFCIFILLAVVPVAFAKELPRIQQWVADFAPPPELPDAEAAILVEPRSGTVLFEKNADGVIPPASLTKVVSIHTARLIAENSGLDLDEPRPVPERAWAQNMPPRSSLMFLGPDQQASLWELFRGMAVPSGNDAAVAVAIRTAGSVDSFVDTMNRVVHDMGYDVLRFADPAGLSSRNRITAREYADFVAHYIERWPEALDELHSVESLTYPRAVHYNGTMRGGGITQYNGNGLLRSYPGADGIKTGFTWASGYNLAASAEQDGYRLIAVVLGVEADTHRRGGRIREGAAATLLDYGFENFETAELGVPAVDPVRVWKGSAREVAPSVPESAEIVVPAGRTGAVRGVVDVPSEVIAPVDAGQLLGEIRYTVGNRVVHRIEVSAADPVPRGGFFRRLWHSLVLAVRDFRDQLGVASRGGR
jgi:D-alanyl-D-alanine carboxypeptidase (penicillin-binding protein 5/6)